MRALIDKLQAEGTLAPGEFADLIRADSPDLRDYAGRLARRVADRSFGDRIFIRGLVEFTNHCRNDCLYCGIRRSNRLAERYRMTPEEILDRCRIGRELGFRTFVLQGGEDPHYAGDGAGDDRLAGLVAAIRAAHPDCAITLSVGERNGASYRRLYAAGANRYLLRHETADPGHYARLHPAELALSARLACLWELKDIGFQTGCGFMVGSPFQTPETLAADLLFLRDFQPHMVGIGPFIPHHDTPFADRPAGDVGLTLFLLSLIRLMLPRALLPATTALGTLDPSGREKGVLAGANVVMPNLSPPEAKRKYLLYDNKLSTGAEAAEHLEELRRRMAAIGYRVVEDRGDFGG